ncbi:MAG: TonB family protein [Pseudodesulfovibrio sp.]|nr:TonB family protein [Pseudodesulfovibrio sp.]
MRFSLGFVFSLLFHAALVAFALFWVNGQNVRINMDRPVYTVDLVTLAPPLPEMPVPVVEAKPEVDSSTTEVPVVEASPETVTEAVVTPVVEAKAKPEVEKISPKKVEKKIVVKKKKEKPKPKPKPKKTAKQLLAEGLNVAKAKTKKEEQKKVRALASELAALKKQEGAQVYAHGGQSAGVTDGREGGVAGGTGSGLSEVYALIVGTAIKKNWRFPTFSGEANLFASVEIVLEDDGKIISSKVIESSNNPEFDSSALRAIKETEYVEKPRTHRDRVLRINFNSQELSE